MQVDQILAGSLKVVELVFRHVNLTLHFIHLPSQEFITPLFCLVVELPMLVQPPLLSPLANLYCRHDTISLSGAAWF